MSNLRDYQKKRKFDETPEPRGKVKRGKGPLRFVVQMHRATRLHFDLRLEMGGVFKSWAVPKGPSLNPLNQRLAVFVEDHPLEYGSFEGIIPKGNYGAGTVMVWDYGTVTAKDALGRAASEAQLLEGLENGDLKFVLSGKKLNGEFVLVKLKQEDQKAWLLIKKRDEYSGYSESMPEPVSAKSGRTMDEIAKESGAQGTVWISKRKTEPRPSLTKRGKAAKTAVSIPRRTRPMLPTFSPELPSTKDWAIEAMPEGLRAMAECDRFSVKLYSRSLLPFDKKFPDIIKRLRDLKLDAVLDGEIVSKKKKNIFVVLDLLYLNGIDLREKPFESRRDLLTGLDIFDDQLKLNPLISESQIRGVEAKYLLVRKKNAPYLSGTSGDWLKIESKSLKKTGQKSAIGRGPIFSNLGKVMFPEDGYTKKDVIDYYRSVSPFLLPHLVDRPESLHRHPDGIHGEGFFHKNMTSYLPKWVRTVRIRSESAGTTINYLLCQNESTLLYLANYGCIELNPWNSRVEHLDHPDYVIIDLDPDDNDFEEVVVAAQTVHRYLENIGVASWCKTSGATGLHICVPTHAKFDYDTCREFAEKVCRAVHEELPDFTSVERNPAKRKGRIYLDFLQNRRGQTLAAPYSLRPRPGAPVSTPLRWTEVKRGLTPATFTIQTIHKRLEKLGDLWKPMLTESIDIAKALKTLNKSA